MGVIEKIKPSGDGAIQLDEDPKVKKPDKFQVVMTHDGIIPIPCAACILKEVFNKSRFRAYSHIFESISKGKSSIMVGTQEVAEHKEGEANMHAFDKSIVCNRRALEVRFFLEPI